MAWVLLVLGALAFAAALIGLFSPRRPTPFVVGTFFTAWLMEDLAAFHIVGQVVVTLGLLAISGFDVPALGWVGVGLTAAAITVEIELLRRHRTAAPALDAALREVLGPDTPSVAAEPVRLRDVVVPFPPSAAGVRITRNLAYGPHRRNRLNVYAPAHGRTGCPVVLQIHGGAWFSGNKDQQGQPLMRQLARRGWVCVAPNYRLSPEATFPDHLVDVKKALAWIRENVAEHGGDPSFVIVTGGSAGGHLASLVALTANDPMFQPGFEDVDTSVAACVPMYAVFDFLNRDELRTGLTLRVYEGLLHRLVMKVPRSAAQEMWEKASPLSWTRPDVPPFFVVEGALDTLVWREEAQRFVGELRDVSESAVGYAEVPDAQHAFDVLMNRRSIHTVRAVTAFMEAVRDGRVR